MLSSHVPASRAALVAAIGSLAFAIGAPAAAGVVGSTPPVISGAPATTTFEGVSYSFQPTVFDADGDLLRFRIRGKPSWAGFDRQSGKLSGTPKAGTAGTYANIIISVTDGKNVASLPSFSITVTAVNHAPTISGTPANSVLAGQLYSFAPTASDVDSDPLTFSIQGKPAWASFSYASGTLSGTPASTDVGTFSGIVISVTDGKTSTSLPAFSITVTAVNHAPTISGTPVTVAKTSVAYYFQPTASDVDGDTLTFQISGRPSWASFNASNGALYGTPGDSAAGTYSGIQIRVSDGKVEAALPTFSITVSPPVVGSAKLSWRAPTQNEDGTPLTDLAGYVVRYSKNPGNLDQNVTVSSSSVTTIVIDNLPEGTWFFTVSSVNAGGVESAPTVTVSKIIS